MELPACDKYLSQEPLSGVILAQSFQVDGLPSDLRKPRYNTETEEAMQEARDIMAGKVGAKSYASVDEMLADL